MKVINVQQAKTQLSRYLEEVANGKELVLGKNGKPIARLVPYVEKKPARKLGGAKGWLTETFLETDYEMEYLANHSPVSSGDPSHAQVEAEAKLFAQVMRENSAHLGKGEVVPPEIYEAAEQEVQSQLRKP